jgi:electron transport complex protein RnfG
MSTPQNSHSAINISLRTAVILLLFTSSFTALMAVTYLATKDTIAASAEEEKLKLIGEVLPSSSYDNALLKDFIELPAMPALGLDQPSRAYRARKGGEPVALVFEAAAADGYSGRIGLILAVRKTGEVIAVRVTSHKETPGLGDYIDPRKDKNKEHPWISQFAGQSFASLPPAQWKVKKDGGHFDQHSGATISARAVTNAVARAVKWTADQGEQLFAGSNATPVANP